MKARTKSHLKESNLVEPADASSDEDADEDEQQQAAEDDNDEL